MIHMLYMYIVISSLRCLVVLSIAFEIKKNNKIPMEYVSEFIILIICSPLFPLRPSFRSKIIIRLLYFIVYLGFTQSAVLLKRKIAVVRV